jgi:hypothetical protein
MMESSYLLEANMRHYKELLRRESLTEKQREHVQTLLAETQAQLLKVVEQESERARNAGFWVR